MSVTSRTFQPRTRRARHHPECTCDPDTVTDPWKADLCQILHAEDHVPLQERLDELADFHAVSVTRVVSRIQRAARPDPGDWETVMSYLMQALRTMVNERWSAKIGTGASAVFDYSWNLAAVLEAEAKSRIRTDRRYGLLADTTVEASYGRD